MNTTTVTPEAIYQKLNQVFCPTQLEVLDEEKHHHAHANHKPGHFRIMIRSTAFAGKTRIETHRMIYEALEPLINQGIHALAIDAKADHA